MQLHRCGSKQLECSDHQDDDRDVLGKVGVRADCPTQGSIVAVAKANAIAAAQKHDAHAQDGVDETEHSKIRGADDRWVHVRLLTFAECMGTPSDPNESCELSIFVG